MSRAYFVLDGTTGSGITIADNAGIEVNGDIDLRAVLAANDWTPATDDRSIIEKWAGGSSYIFRISQTDGLLEIFWNDGTGNSTAASSTAPTIADGAAVGVRVTLNVNTGAGDQEVKFYTKPFAAIPARALTDNTGWTQLGTTQTVVGGKTSINDTGAAVDFGHRGTNDDLFAGRFYEAVVMDGIEGTTVIQWVADDYENGITFEDMLGNTINLTGADWVFYPGNKFAHGWTTRATRLFTQRLRNLTIEDGHAEDDAPYLDTS